MKIKERKNMKSQLKRKRKKYIITPYGNVVKQISLFKRINQDNLFTSIQSCVKGFIYTVLVINELLILTI